MTETSQTLQKAVADLAVIRRAIGSAQDEADSSNRTNQTAIGANIMLQGAALFIAVFGIIAELASGHNGTQQFLDSAFSANLRMVGLVQLGLMVAVLAGALYFLVYRAAKRSKRDFERYVSRNFAYLKNLSFLSDLAIKFGVIAIVILAQKPEWIAPVCMLFIGDYLIQGRFFTVPLTAAMVLGAGCMIGALAMFYFSSALLIWPFTAFAAVTAISLVQVISLRKSPTQQNGEEA